MLWRMQNIISCPVALCVTRQILLQVLEETSEAEVVDVSTEKHQLWVDVLGHTVVGGHGAANNGWHHQGGGTVAHTLPMAFYQGTKSGKSQKQDIKLNHLQKTFRETIKITYTGLNCLKAE